ncbi:TTC37-like protein [Mya arenaria]|uniref:TTC37-like protein n=1 Tax=Mya arenaria TaxID=6604 RepID=A0ABY7DX07_MYAAR|nr:TTC37-like protein [Mya arenaria]
MDAKEVKSALKKAREAIRQKEYNEALGVCKDIIASDGSNYMAFVLTAVAAEGLSQNDQALGAYRRARDGDSIFKLAQTYLQVYPGSSVVLKHSILGCLDNMIVDETVATRLPDLVSRYEAVLGGCNCDVMTVAKAAIAFTRKDCTSVRKILQQLSSSGGQLVCVVCLQAKMEFELHQYISAIRTCKTAMDLVNRKDAILTQPCGSIRQVINVLTVRSLTQIGDTASLNRALGIIEKSLLEQETDNSSHLVNLAKCLWETGEDNQQCFTLLLKAAKLDPNNSMTFLYLGHYYIQVGKDKLRARKCYQKAFDLDPSCSEAGEPLHVWECLGEAYLLRGSYTASLKAFTRAAELNPASIYWLGETLVQIGRSLLNQCFYGRARDTAELAVKHLYRAGRLRPDVSCLWKLIGDACTIIHVLPEKGFRFERPEKGNMTKLETLEFGNISGDTAISLAEKSVQSLKKAIQLEPTNHKHWNALGFVACRKVYNKSSLAQHCFIKSIKVEANNVVAWTNLAALYLKKENVKLAHEAFKVAQSLEPSYVACWVGQAIIAEVVGHEDAMDLFRHTTELSHHVEGAIGYGQWVCSVLLQSDKKGTKCNQTNPVAYNLHALLLERQGLALLLCESGQENAEILKDVLANCARCYRKNGDYPMACQLYKKLGEQSRVEDLYQFGLALYQGGDCKGAIQVYSQAAELATTDKEKSHILVTMAMVYYKMNDLNQTKTILFQSSQSSEASPAGLKALCALGLLQSDITLATAAVQELSKLGGENSHLYDFTLLQCILNLAQDETDTALALVQASLEDSTTQGDCWYLLTLLLLMFYPSKSGIATQAARNKEQLLVPVADIKHGYHGNKTSCRNAFLSAQRAVHLYPDKKEGWLTLTSAVGVEAASAMDDERRRSLMTFRYNMLVNVAQLDLDPVFCLWCLQQRVACAALAGLHKEVMDDLDKLMTDYGEEKEATDFFNLMRKYLAENP